MNFKFCWYITNGGDGFESAVDPENPNIVYAQLNMAGWFDTIDIWRKWV